MFLAWVITFFLLILCLRNWAICNSITNKTASKGYDENVRRPIVGVDLIRRQEAEPFNQTASGGGHMAVKKSKRKMLKKRLRRALGLGDGDEPPVRKPVELTSCLCPYCSDGPEGFQNGLWENVAFNKPANASSTLHDGERRFVGPCGALNGNATSETGLFGSPRPNCYRNQAFDYFPWFTVDLEYVYTFRIITFIKSNEHAGGLCHLLLTVDTALCKYIGSMESYNQNNNNQAEFSVTCDSVMTGRHVRVQKHLQRNTANSNYTSVLSFCELQVWVCKPNTHGLYYIRRYGCRPCPERCPYDCNNVHGCSKGSTMRNVAIMKSVTISSLTVGHSSYLTDGIIFYPRDQHSDTRKVVANRDTSTQELHWITVALGSTFKVLILKIHSRYDCCSPQSLRKFRVLVTQTNAQKFAEDTEDTCVYVEEGVPTGVIRRIPCSTRLTGRYVHVMKWDTYGLALSNLEVMGYPRYQLVPGAACSDYYKEAVCVQGTRCVNGQCRIEENQDCTSGSYNCTEGLSCYQGVCVNIRSIRQPCDTGVCSRGMMCDVSSKTCRRIPGNPCSSDIECETRGLCDALSRCRLRVGQECQHDLQCAAGARCVQSRCACDTEVSVQEGDLCRPSPSRVGSSCSTDDDCQGGSSTSCENQVCVCSGGKTTSRLFGCRLSVGSECTNGSSEVNTCNEDMICERGVCKIKIGHSCPRFSEHCTYAATCEDNICKPITGYVCASTLNNVFQVGNDYCSGDLVCSESICKHRLGSSCSTQRGPVCDDSVCSSRDNNTCKLDVGQSCASDINRQHTQCRAGTFCQDATVCKVDTGEPCKNTQDCRNGSTCGPRFGSATKRCRLTLGSAGCRNDEDCADSTVCDLQRVCRVPKNGACQRGLGMCLEGAVCSDDDFCQCNPDVTDAASDKCDPKPGQVGGVCVDGATCSDNAECRESGEKSTCQCPNHYVTNLRDLSCRINAGFPCKEGDTGSRSSCISEAECVNGMCILRVGAQCRGDRQAHCPLNSVCDVDGTCRVNIHHSCLNDNDSCRLGTACDSLHRCKHKSRGECTADGDCMAGSRCSEEGQCECTPGVTTLSADTCLPENGVVGGKCQEGGGCRDSLASCSQNTGLCQCQQGYSGTPANLACAKVLDGECVKDSECVSGLVCDPDDGRCRIQLGQMCDMGNERMCATGLVCDFDSICKLGLNGKCSGENNALCKSETFCDWLGTCKVGVGAVCKKLDNETEDPCPAGARCVGSVCTCDLEMAADYGIICKPNKGRYGGSCETQCAVQNSQCVDNVCQCKENFKPDTSFNCVGVGLDEKSSLGTVLWTVIVTLGILALLLLILFLAVARRRQKHKQAARKILSEERAASMQEVIRLKESVNELKEAESNHLKKAEANRLEEAGAKRKDSVESSVSMTLASAESDSEAPTTDASTTIAGNLSEESNQIADAFNENQGRILASEKEGIQSEARRAEVKPR